MGTRDALNKLNEKQMKYCKTFSSLIEKDRNKGAKEQHERDAGHLRGFLECLEQLEIISRNDLKCLYLYFFSEDRSDK